MKPAPTRLALLVSLIGLSLSCSDRAMAEDEIAADAAEKPAAPSADWALGLQSEHPAPSMRDTLGLMDAQSPTAGGSGKETSAQATAATPPPPHAESGNVKPAAEAEPVALPEPELPIAEQQLLALPPPGPEPAAPTPQTYVLWLPDPGPRPSAPSPQDDVNRSWPALANNRVDASKSDEPERPSDLHLSLNAALPTRVELEGLGIEYPSDANSNTEDAPAPHVGLSPMDQIMESLAGVLMAELPQRTASLAAQPAPRQESAAVDTRAETDTLTRWAERPEITVAASHGDRVLMSLATLLAKEETPPEQHDRAQTSEIIVSTHTERVLETLAAVLPEHRKERKREPMGDGWLALDEHKLDEARGGFITDTGVRIAFGVERAVYLNGTLVTTTTLNVSELGNVSAGHSGTGASGTGNVLLLQNGQGNTFSTAAASNSTFGTVIQNTLNDQNIKSITTINATVNSLQVLRGMNLQSALRSAITGSLRK